ncbi:MAG: prepilin-type N-terminal cleavage/methylation domain-containing protein [Verrucomicrobia bacterium]|nr:MAG: prepilin-type N-terminal cleavage/methylation domain-containing protein [Verrucomicrobiota bacterium]
MNPARSRRGFSLIEMLTVIAIISILAAILIPVVGKVQVNARKAKTRVQFNEWAAAIHTFRLEFGYYPDFSGISGNLIDTAEDTRIFVETLSGHALDGSALGSGDPGYAAGNTQGITFYSFSTEDLTDGTRPLLRDGFGNTQIAVLPDLDYDGMIEIGGSGDYATAPALANGVPSDLASGTPIRSGVIFYSPGAGETAGDIVTSW